MVTLWSDYYDSVYKQYLDYLYASLDNKQRSSDQWPPSATKKFFRLAMIEAATVRRGYIENSFVQMTITGKVDRTSDKSAKKECKSKKGDLA